MNLQLNDRHCFTIRQWENYLVEVVPMIYNDRLVLSPVDCPDVYDYGWCYPKSIAAILAAQIWDLNTDDEPPGFLKRATSNKRQAPQRNPDAVYRCVHGNWPGTCTNVGCIG